MPSQSYKVSLDRTANAPVTEGIHPFKIVAGDEGEGPAGPYWRFTLTCLTKSEKGKNVIFIISLSPQARWRCEIFLDAIGAPQTGTATIDNFVGRSFRAKVTHELYEGRKQARIQEMFPMSVNAAPQPVEEIKIKKVNVVSPPSAIPDDVLDDFPKEQKSFPL